MKHIFIIIFFLFWIELFFTIFFFCIGFFPQKKILKDFHSWEEFQNFFKKNELLLFINNQTISNF